MEVYNSNNNNTNNNIIAPFVMKTYQMVNDPATDLFITWGKANNSFVVIDPLEFSQRILPVFFKHNNFSSFVRQLNTYGFKKVDPDRWEFANEHFLRGQKHLLKNIMRRKHSTSRRSYLKHGDCDEEEIVMEIARLKREQKALEQELQGMNERLEATEKRPQQMMAFLCKVAEDPDLLPRMMLEKGRNMQRQLGAEKKRRLMISAASSSSSGMAATTTSSVKTEDDVEEDIDGRFDVENFCQSPETNNQQAWWCQYASVPMPLAAFSGAGMAVSPPENDGSMQMSYSGTQMAASPPPPYPFSLLEGGF